MLGHMSRTLRLLGRFFHRRHLSLAAASIARMCDIPSSNSASLQPFKVLANSLVLICLRRKLVEGRVVILVREFVASDDSAEWRIDTIKKQETRFDQQ